MVGHKVEQLYPERPAGNGEVLLEVRGIRRLPAGAGREPQGPRGRGRSGSAAWSARGAPSSCALIYGIDTRTRARSSWRASPCRPTGPTGRSPRASASPPRTASRRASLLDWSLTKNVSLADLGRFSRGLLERRAPSARPPREQLRALQTVPDDADRIVRQLSGGNQQKVVLARWLLRHCRVLLLDEPTRGVDVATKAELYRVIADLAAPGSASWSSRPSSRSWSGSARRILVMREGELVAEVEGEERDASASSCATRSHQPSHRPGRGGR